MTDRAINFTAPMVQAVLDGRKTMTRKVLKSWGFPQAPSSGKPPPAPLNIPGDRLWVREAFVGARDYDRVRPAEWGNKPIWYPADGQPDRATWGHLSDRTHPAGHMSRWASRLTLIVTDVRVERLQDISEADAIAEGATSRPRCYGFNGLRDGWSMDWSQVGAHSRYAENGPGPLTERDVALVDPSSAFGAYVNELHGGPSWNLKPTDLWTENPWVAAVSFETHRCNIDAMPAAEPAKADDGWTDWPAMAGATDKVDA